MVSFVGSFIFPSGCQTKLPTLKETAIVAGSVAATIAASLLIDYSSRDWVDKTADLRQRVGPQAQNVVSRLNSSSAPLLSNTLQIFALQFIDNVQNLCKKTSPQKLLENLSAVTDFLPVYRQAFIELSGKKFTSIAKAEAAWKPLMGDYWQQERSPHFHKVAQLINSECSLPIPQSILSWILEVAIEYKLADNLEQKQTALYSNAHRMCTQIAGQLGLLPASYPPVSNHEILVDEASGKKLVAWRSSIAQGRGIQIGMDAQKAVNLWNSSKSSGEADAVIVTGQLGMHYTLHALVQKIIAELLVKGPDSLRIKLLQMPVAGRLFLGAALHVLQIGVQLLGKEVIAKEFADAFLLHITNPALPAVLNIGIDRFLSHLLQAKEGGVDMSDSSRETFLGELAIEFSKTLTTFSPSLFRLKHPKIVAALARGTFWLVRKSVGAGILLVGNWGTQKSVALIVRVIQGNEQANRVQKIFTESRALGWMLVSQSELVIAHTYLSKAYKALGEKGFVSIDQKHFENGSKSAAHLIHHTALAFLRYYLSKENVSFNKAKQDKKNFIYTNIVKINEIRTLLNNELNLQTITNLELAIRGQVENFTRLNGEAPDHLNDILYKLQVYKSIYEQIEQHIKEHKDPADLRHILIPLSASCKQLIQELQIAMPLLKELNQKYHAAVDGEDKIFRFKEVRSAKVKSLDEEYSNLLKKKDDLISKRNVAEELAKNDRELLANLDAKKRRQAASTPLPSQNCWKPTANWDLQIELLDEINFYFPKYFASNQTEEAEVLAELMGVEQQLHYLHTAQGYRAIALDPVYWLKYSGEELVPLLNGILLKWVEEHPLR